MTNIINCCKSTSQKICKRKDNKTFKLPRRFTQKKCLTMDIKGFSMKSSCAPYKFCKTKKNSTKKQFFFNPNNPKTSFDVYIDKNPNDTIPIKYTTIQDVKDTISNLEKLYKAKKFSHKRIWQVGMILKVRLNIIYKYKDSKFPNATDVYPRVNLANKYYNFLKQRTKLKGFEQRSKFVFEF